MCVKEKMKSCTSHHHYILIDSATSPPTYNTKEKYKYTFHDGRICFVKVKINVNCN